MKDRNFGRIINIRVGPWSCFSASPYKSAYVAAHSNGMVGLTKTVALEVAETGHQPANANLFPGFVGRHRWSMARLMTRPRSMACRVKDVIRDIVLASAAEQAAL